MRKPSITRTIKIVNVTVLGADLDMSELVNKTFPVYASEFPKNPEKQFEYMRKMYESDSFKISQIVDTTNTEKTYTMPLAQFLEVAEVVEPKQNAETETEPEREN